MMDSKESKKAQSGKPENQRAPYEAPAIIYEGLISTRAGSPVGFPDGSGEGVDPADLFGD